MTTYILRRLIYMVVVLFVVALITFLLMHAVPGGPFDKEKPLPAQIRANIAARYHLDDPLPVQFFAYLSSIAIPRVEATGPSRSVDDDFLVNIPLGKYWLKWMNFGPSYASLSRTVNDIFRDQLP